MEDYVNEIDEKLWKFVKDGNYREYLVENVGTVGTAVDMITPANTRKACDKKALHEFRGALPLVVYNYVRGCTVAKEIWDTLKEKY